MLSIIISTVHLLGILHAAHAVLHTRTSQGAIAWAISLVTFPWIALPFYWVFGRSKLARNVSSLKAGELRIEAQTAEVLRTMLEFRHRRAPANENGMTAATERLTRIPCTAGNAVTLLIDGEQTFGAMMKAIAAAKDYVLIQFFIVEEGRLADSFFELLCDKAREGVDVYLLYDELGSRKLSKMCLRELKQAGVRISAFRAILGPGHRMQLNFRNHRKITVVDGYHAFVGGLNLGDEYLGKSCSFGAWRDTHLQVTGPATQGIQLAFLKDWHWATAEIPELNWEPRLADENGRPVAVVPTGPADDLDTCQLFVLELIHAAREHLWIASPYFVPGPEVCAALKLAVVRGVDVRVLLPHSPDHILVYLASFSYYADMLGSGIKLYRYQPGFMHQKVILVDREAAAVGTVNLDNRSFHLNFEINLLVPESTFATDVAEMLARDFAESRAVRLTDFTERSLPFRLSVHVARLLSPIL
jgi:cardiolipin synthase